MKQINLFFLVIVFTIQANGQLLIDSYKTGNIILAQENDFSKGTNWNEVFPDYDLVIYGKNIGYYKSIAVAPDGSIFVGNYSSYSIQKFDTNGNMLFSFGKKGKAEGDFIERPTLGGVVSGKYVFTHEHNGHIKLFTLDGKFLKTISLDYMPLKAIALNSNKIAVIGHVSIGKSVRHVVTIIDPETGIKQIIKKFDDLWKNGGLTITKNNCMYGFSPSFSKNEVIIRPLQNGNILIGVNTNKTLEIYTTEGKLVNSFDLDFTPLEYPIEYKKKFIVDVEKSVSEGKFTKEEIAPIYKDNFFQKYIPYYYNILVDSDGNILVFQFVDEDVDHKFRVYTIDSKGQNVAETILELQDYKLSLNYRFEEIAFYKGKVIGLINPAGNNTEPYHLMKFDITRNQ